MLLLLANNFAPHELLELHELLASETTAALKLQASARVVQDNQLQALIQRSLTAKQSRLHQMVDLVNTAATSQQ